MTATNYPNINEKSDGDCGYVAFYAGKGVGVYASGAWPATEAARAYFNPPKSKRHMVSVHLAEDRDGNVVAQSTAQF